MQVILKDGDTQYVLCHGGERGVGLHVGADGFGHDSRIRTQVREYIDGDYSRPKARGNRLPTIVVVVNVEFSTLEECTRYNLNYPQTIPSEGTVRFVSTKTDGSRETWELSDAVIEDIYMGPQRGVSTTIRYTIKGSSFTQLN